MELRYVLYRLIALLSLILSAPFLAVALIAVKLDSPGPFLFKQKRMGLHKKPFYMYKIRTMVSNAQRLKTKFKRFNEADGPVFKIHNDPRFTRVGKLLSRGALDEIPQFINVIKGEMSLVGPRPLPWSEGQHVPLYAQKRFMVLPGMTSSWVVSGSHKLSFRQWMLLDAEYVEKNSLSIDMYILVKTCRLVIGYILRAFSS